MNSSATILNLLGTIWPGLFFAGIVLVLVWWQRFLRKALNGNDASVAQAYYQPEQAAHPSLPLDPAPAPAPKRVIIPVRQVDSLGPKTE